MTRFIPLLLICFLTAPFVASSQEYTIKRVKSPIGFEPIYDGDELSGYFCIYEADSGKKTYKLDLFDRDLSRISSTPIVKEKRVSLLDGAATENAVLLLFFNAKSKAFTYRLFDREGEQQSSDSFAFLPQFGRSKWSHYLMRGLSGWGFLHYVADSGIYSIQLIAHKGAPVDGWKVEKVINAPVLDIGFLGFDHNLLISSITTVKGASEKDAEYFVLGTDLVTGEEIFETKIEAERYDIRLTNTWLADEGIYLFGSYFEKGAKVFSGKSLGLCTFLMDTNGHIVSQKYLSWASDISGFLPSDSRGKIEGIGYLYFHEFIKTKNGKMIGLAENYRKTANAVGIVSNILIRHSNSAYTKMTVEDLYLFEFTHDFSIRSVRIFDKKRTNVEISFTQDFDSPQLLAKDIKAMGGFDYIFTDFSGELSEFGIYYFDEISNRKRVVGSIIYDGQEMTRQESDIYTFSPYAIVGAFPAKPGYILTHEYLPGKRIDLKLERLVR